MKKVMTVSKRVVRLFHVAIDVLDLLALHGKFVRCQQV